MNKKNLENQVLDEIQSRGLEVKPKWFFVFKNVLVWLLFTFTVILGSLSFSLIFFHFKAADWEFFEKIRGSFFSFIIFYLPYFWILLFIFLSYLAYLEFKKTDKGYKINLSLFVFSNLFLSMAFGYIFFQNGIAKGFESFLYDKAPLYEKVVVNVDKIWSRPSEGFLSGVIVQNNFDEKVLLLIDLNGVEWEVFYTLSSITPPKRELNERVIADFKERFKQGFKVKVVGEIDEDFVFIADHIRPYEHNLPLRKIPNFRKKSLKNERKILLPAY